MYTTGNYILLNSFSIFRAKSSKVVTLLLASCNSSSEQLIQSKFLYLTKYISILSIFLPENSIDEIPFTALKTEIDKNGLNSNFKFIGDNWIKSNSSLLLKVPSIVIPEEYNYLVNPLHKNFNKVKIVENKLFRFDNRLVTK